MKNKSTLPLMEQLVMITVFALAAALCLQAFLTADRISRRQEYLAEAVLLAQNTAEELKYTHGESIHTIPRHDEFEIKITPVPSPDPLLGCACIYIFWENESLFELNVSWQEVSANEVP